MCVTPKLVTRAALRSTKRTTKPQHIYASIISSSICVMCICQPRRVHRNYKSRVRDETSAAEQPYTPRIIKTVVHIIYVCKHVCICRGCGIFYAEYIVGVRRSYGANWCFFRGPSWAPAFADCSCTRGSDRHCISASSYCSGCPPRKMLPIAARLSMLGH